MADVHEVERRGRPRPRKACSAPQSGQAKAERSGEAKGRSGPQACRPKAASVTPVQGGIASSNAVRRRLPQQPSLNKRQVASDEIAKGVTGAAWRFLCLKPGTYSFGSERFPRSGISDCRWGCGQANWIF
jgi:hypothetical protein